MRKMGGAAGVILATALVLTLHPTLARAQQQGTISGVVRDDGGQTVANATVRIPTTELGALTDEQGRYVLEVEPGTHRLEASRIGLSPAARTVTVQAGEEVTVNFVLSTRGVDMGELIATVTAGTAERRQRGTDIEVLDASEAVDRGTGENFSDLLNSRVPGVSINESSGEVGTASSIRIRGATSITQDNNPLVYVDGVRVSNNTGTGPSPRAFPEGQTISRLDDLEPQDIASVQVVKGPTATAQYGSEAAAGVVLIETKRGSEAVDGPRFRFMTEHGFNEDLNDYPGTFTNLTELVGITDVGRADIQPWNPVSQPVTGDVLAFFNPLEDPRTEPFERGRLARWFLSVSGGGEDVDYYASGSWDDLHGTLDKQEVDRVNGRVNLSARLSETFDLDVSTSFVNGRTAVIANDRSILGNVTNGLAGIPLFSFGSDRPEDCLASVVLGAPPSACSVEGNLFGNFEQLKDPTQEQDVERFIGSSTLRWEPIPWLSTRLSGGVDFVRTEDLFLVVPNPDLPFGDLSRGAVDLLNATEEIVTVDLVSTASFDLSESIRSSTTAGAQGFFRRNEGQGCSGDEFASGTAVACDAGLSNRGFSTFSEVNELGAFFQQELGINGYLFLNGALRVDDNTSLGAQEDVIVSPSANVSAVVSDMPFWNVDFLDEFRLRGAWGKAAQAPDPFAADATFAPRRLSQGGMEILGVSPLAPGNPNLTAEESEEFELGFDVSALDGRLGLDFTYFNSEVTDAIFPTLLAPSLGFSEPQFVNIGAVTNQGVEASVDALVLDTDAVRWRVNFQVSTVDPLISDLGGVDPILGCVSVQGSQTGIFVEGLPPGTLCGREVAEAERDAAGEIIPESVVIAPGNIDAPGVPDGLRNFGHQTPTNEQNLSTTITLFDNFRLYTLFNRKAGASKFCEWCDLMNPLVRTVVFKRFWAFRHSELTPEDQAELEREGEFSPSVLIRDMDFIRWRELSASYDFPQDFVRSLLGFDAVRLDVGVKNLGVATDWIGIDPETRLTGGTDQFNNSEQFTQGPATNFTARLNLIF